MENVFSHWDRKSINKYIMPHTFPHEHLLLEDNAAKSTKF